MYRETKVFTCDLCQNPITRRPFPSLSLPLTDGERSRAREELERHAELAHRHAPPMVQSMLGLGAMVVVPTHYTIHLCDGCLRKLAGDLLETLKASCFEQLLEDGRQRRLEDRDL